jgi:FeS assembly protein IscX
MQWSDIEEIVEALEENYTDIEIDSLKMTKLHKFIIELPEFDDSLEAPTQLILEEIYESWLELRQENEEHY